MRDSRTVQIMTNTCTLSAAERGWENSLLDEREGHEASIDCKCGDCQSLKDELHERVKGSVNDDPEDAIDWICSPSVNKEEALLGLQLWIRYRSDKFNLMWRKS